MIFIFTCGFDISHQKSAWPMEIFLEIFGAQYWEKEKFSVVILTWLVEAFSTILKKKYFQCRVN